MKLLFTAFAFAFLACCSGNAQDSIRSCNELTAKATSSAGIPFDKQTTSEQAARFLDVTRDFNSRILLTLVRITNLKTQKEFEEYNRWTVKHDDLCYKQWSAINEQARANGVYGKASMQGELLREVKLEDQLWNRMMEIVASHMSLPQPD